MFGDLRHVEHAKRLERAGLAPEGHAGEIARWGRFWRGTLRVVLTSTLLALCCGLAAHLLATYSATFSLLGPLSRPLWGAIGGALLLSTVVAIVLPDVPLPLAAVWGAGGPLGDRGLLALLAGAALYGQAVPRAPVLFVAWLVLTGRRLHGVWVGTHGGVRLDSADVGELAQQPAPERWWAVERIWGAGVLSLLSAPPGLGKGWWLWAALRAMQDGSTFFGLPVRAARVLWMTEEGPSFEETARRFGIAPGLVEVVRREALPVVEWPALVPAIRALATRKQCPLIVVDTIRAWCPEAETGAAPDVMNTVRAELTRYGFGVLFVHHDTKAGGEHGTQVAGHNSLVGSVDVLIALRRVAGQDTARRMLVSRRFGEQDRTATLVGVRYVIDGEPSTESRDNVMTSDAPPAFAGITQIDRDTKEWLRQLEQDEPQAPSQREIARRAGVAYSTWLDRTKHANRLYDAYMVSAEWKRRAQAVRERAEGRCEGCGSAAGVDVHHETYRDFGAESLDQLRLLCRPCHQARHPWQHGG